MSAVEGIHDGRRILIPVVIVAPVLGAEVQMMDGLALVDTGSTTSGVKQSVARSLGLVGLGKRPLGSAGGEVQAERYLFSLGLRGSATSAPSFPFIFEEVMGFELKASFQFDALIGMDILRQCDLAIERNGRFRLGYG